MHTGPNMLMPLLDALPVGVILVDADDRISAWNPLAEQFIAAVGRPTLFVGMTLDETHEGDHGRGMRAVVERLRSGSAAPAKEIAVEGAAFRVHYKGLFDGDVYLGIAQVIEFVEIR